MNEVSDVRETLAALDRRLGEIRQHMVTILEEVEAHTNESEPAGETVDHVEPMTEPAPPATNGPSPDPDSAADAFPLAGAPAHAAPAPEPEPKSSPARGEKPPPEPEPRADPEPSRSAESEPPAPGGGADVERLQQLRERLLESAREIDALRRVAAEPRGGRVVFEGEVTLVVRGVDRVGTLMALEEGFQNRPGIQQAVVSTYVPGEARIRLTLTEPMELAAELERVLPFKHTLRASSCLEVVVEFGN